MKVLQELDVASSKAFDIEKAVIGKKSVSDFTENAKKDRCAHFNIL